MKIQFVHDQPHQLEPIKTIIDLFEGQIHLDETDVEEMSLKSKTDDDALEDVSDLALFSNRLTIDREQIYSKVREIQKEKKLPICSETEVRDNGLNFTVEMETGTGKTYVYLRTIFELNKKYGFKKFIIVVPNVAIREGVLKNLEITKSEFKRLYEIACPDFFLYDSERLNKVSDFVSSENIQIMIINIQAFNKETAIFNKQHYKLNGYSPQEVIGETSPIVIIDEPQIVDNTEKGKEAIQSLNPLFTIRYSATHREIYNQIHRLSPIDAFEKELVKQIQVYSVGTDNEYNNAYVSLLEIDNRNGIRAKVMINKQLAEGVKKEVMWIKSGDNLFEKSNRRLEYENGFEVQEISAADNGYVEFSSQVLRFGQEIGSLKEDIVRQQIKSLIKSHFEKQKQVNGKLKVLSLIFLDRVSNYRKYDEDGTPSKGQYAEIFEEEYTEYLKKFKPVNALPVELVHDGYFSSDKGTKGKQGKLKDTKGDAKDDADTYNKIMRDKEKLLSIEEPLQFIFSHSALGVGWDNPNVFQICTLNETNSNIKKRQEIGRGLRLPVDINGNRVKDKDINILTIITNESYTEFADKLQKEFEDDCGIIFGVIKVDSFISIFNSNGEELKYTFEESEDIFDALIVGGIIHSSGEILKKDITIDDILIALPQEHKQNTAEIFNRISELSSIKKNITPKVEQTSIQLKYTIEELNNLELFSELWKRISQKTTYKISINTGKLIDQCIKALDEQLLSVAKVKLTVSMAKVKTSIEGVIAEEILGSNRFESINYKAKVPNIIDVIKKKTALRSSTIISIIKGHLKDDRYAKLVFDNPQEYIERASQIIQDTLKSSLVDGVTYEKIDNEFWELKKFESELLVNNPNVYDVKHSIYKKIICDSENEKNFVKWCERFSGTDGTIKMYFKLPNWFKISTPVGSYNPDWALVLEKEPENLYLIRETKTTSRISQLRPGEWDKIRCGKKHFEAISNGSNGDVQLYETAVPNGENFEIGV